MRLLHATAPWCAAFAVGVSIAAVSVAVTACKKDKIGAVGDRQDGLTLHVVAPGVCVVVARGVHEYAITAVTCPASEAPTMSVTP